MVDKIKPLKLEDSTSGSSINFTPTEADPDQDYIAGKGFAFENSNAYLAEKIGRLLGFKIPDASQKLTFLGSGELDYLEVFNGATQTTPNRLAKVTIGYDVDSQPTSETWLIYDTNGTTVLRTITMTYAYTGFDLSTATEVTS